MSQTKKNTTHLIRIFIMLALICFAIIIYLFISHPAKNETYKTKLLHTIQTTTDFETFQNCLFCYAATNDSITLAYTLKNPHAYDIPTLLPKLTNFSYSENGTANLAFLQIVQKSLSHFDRSQLSKSNQLTFDLLSDYVSLSIDQNQYPFFEEMLGPTTGISTNLPVTLGEYPFRTKADVKLYLQLLKQVPAYFDDVIAYQKRKKQLGLTTQEYVHSQTLSSIKSILDTAGQNDNCFLAPFNEKVNEMSSLSKHAKQKYMQENREYVSKYIIPSYQKLYDYLNEETLNKSAICLEKNKAYGLSSCQITNNSRTFDGKSYYALLVKKATNSSKSVEELITLTDQTLKDSLGNILNVALLDPSTYAYYCNHEFESHYETPEGILSNLHLLIKNDFPKLENAPSYEIKNVSKSLASSLSPAFYMLPAIDEKETNTIYTNDIYTNKNNNLFLTLAHEGFPGHLYQTNYFQNCKPAPIRQILDYPGYVEGWATYAEIYAYQYVDYPKGKEQLAALYQNDTLVSLSISSRIDLGVNFENWTLQDVEDFFEKNGFKSYYAKEIYAYVLEAPGNYLSYFIGYLEIMSIKNAYKNLVMENFSEMEFHKKILELGPCDFDTLKRYILEP